MTLKSVCRITEVLTSKFHLLNYRQKNYMKYDLRIDFVFKYILKPLMKVNSLFFYFHYVSRVKN